MTTKATKAVKFPVVFTNPHSKHTYTLFLTVKDLANIEKARKECEGGPIEVKLSQYIETIVTVYHSQVNLEVSLTGCDSDYVLPLF